MRLTAQQKRDLVARYLPILYVSANDVGVPVDPRQFVKNAALWVARRPQLDDKSGWGTDTGAGARRPLVARGAVDLDLLPTYQQEFRNESELWLDCSGWLSADSVDPTRDNREPNLPGLRVRFPGGVVEPTLRAEVCDEGSWLGVGRTATVATTLGLTADELTALMSDAVVINYHFLFAGHYEDAAEVFPDQKRFGAADYEGDWVCFTVVLTADLIPQFAGFYRRYRGQSASFGENRRLSGYKMVPWENAPKFGDRACVLAATGTHNLHPADTLTTPAGSVHVQSETQGYGDNLTDDTNSWVRGAVEENTQVSAAVAGVTLAKILAGGAVAGPFGALVGLVAGLAEAGPIAEAFGKDPGPVEIDPETETPPDGDLDDPNDEFTEPDAVTQSYVIVSGPLDGVSDTDLLNFLTFTASVAERRAWSPQSYDPIDRDVERFWPAHDGPDSLGYCGRWGVRCERDPFNRRAGDILPDFRFEILRSIIPLLPT